MKASVVALFSIILSCQGCSRALDIFEEDGFDPELDDDISEVQVKGIFQIET
jgi:hypothetical protein